MAGCPIKRARKAAVRDPGGSGSVIAFPRLDHPRAGLPNAAWRALSQAEKLERLFNMTLDEMAAILAWPLEGLDPFHLSVKIQVARVILMIGIKAVLDGSLDRELARERNRDAELEELNRRLRETEAAAPDE